MADSSASPNVGAFGSHQTYDRRGEVRSGNRVGDNDYPRPFSLEELTPPAWYLHPKWAAISAVVTLALAVLTVVGGFVISQGYRYDTPGSTLAALDRRLTKLERAVPVIEAGARYTCSKDLAGAQQAGFPCASLLNGKGILDGTASVAKPDGSSTDLLAVVRLR